MVDEIVEAFESYYDKDQLTLKFPEVFAQMVNKDANIELVVSNTLQPMNLVMYQNKIRKSIAHIFINSECLGFQYHDLKQKSDDAAILFSKILEIEEV